MIVNARSFGSLAGPEASTGTGSGVLHISMKSAPTDAPCIAWFWGGGPSDRTTDFPWASWPVTMRRLGCGIERISCSGGIGLGLFRPRAAPRIISVERVQLGQVRQRRGRRLVTETKHLRLLRSEGRPGGKARSIGIAPDGEIDPVELHPVRIGMVGLARNEEGRTRREIAEDVADFLAMARAVGILRSRTVVIIDERLALAAPRLKLGPGVGRPAELRVAPKLLVGAERLRIGRVGISGEQFAGLGAVALPNLRLEVGGRDARRRAEAGGFARIAADQDRRVVEQPSRLPERILIAGNHIAVERRPEARPPIRRTGERRGHDRRGRQSARCGEVVNPEPRKEFRALALGERQRW